jgi:hypothetical protein
VDAPAVDGVADVGEGARPRVDVGEVRIDQGAVDVEEHGGGGRGGVVGRGGGHPASLPPKRRSCTDCTKFADGKATPVACGEASFVTGSHHLVDGGYSAH